MSFIPQFKLYNSTGLGLLYTFSAVNYTNAPQAVEDYVEHTNLRAKGSLIIPGGEKPWDLEIRFTLIGEDYEEITSKIVTLESTVLLNTAYIFRIDKTGGSYFEYKVKRLEPFIYEEGLRINYQKIIARFRVNCW